MWRGSTEDPFEMLWTLTLMCSSRRSSNEESLPTYEWSHWMLCALLRSITQWHASSSEGSVHGLRIPKFSPSTASSTTSFRRHGPQLSPVAEKDDRHISRIRTILRRHTPTLDSKISLRVSFKLPNKTMDPMVLLGAFPDTRRSIAPGLDGLVPTSLVFETIRSLPYSVNMLQGQEHRLTADRPVLDKAALISSETRVARALNSKSWPLLKFKLAPGRKNHVYDETRKV